MYLIFSFPKYWAIFGIEAPPSIVSIMQTRRLVVETSRLELVNWHSGSSSSSSKYWRHNDQEKFTRTKCPPTMPARSIGTDGSFKHKGRA